MQLSQVTYVEARSVARLRGLTIVTVMQPADFRRAHDPAGAATPQSMVRRVLVQREMRPTPMVIGEVGAEETTEMRLVDDDHVIQTLATHGADQTLDVGILPGTPWP